MIHSEIHPETQAGSTDKIKRPPRRINFTVKALASAVCQPGKDRDWVYDTRQPGLCMMVTRAGTKSFYLYHKVNGRPQRIGLGAFHEVSIDQARTSAKKKAGGIAGGADPMAEKREERIKGITLGELFKKYLEEWARERNRSWHTDELRYNENLRPWAARQLTALTKIQVASLHRKLAKTKSQITANRVLSLLSHMFNWATEEIGWEGGNPCKGVKKFTEESRSRFLSAEELPPFFVALDDDQTDPDWRDFFKLLLLTGARRGNVLSMRWDEIGNLDAARWTIPSAKFKNKKPMTVSLSSHVIDILKKRKKDGEWVFPGGGKTGHLMKPEPEWRNVCNRAGLKGVRIHDLRRTFGSWQAQAGVSLNIIGETLGHRSITTTMIYARGTSEAARTSTGNVTAAMWAAARPATVAVQAEDDVRCSD